MSHFLSKKRSPFSALIITLIADICALSNYLLLVLELFYKYEFYEYNYLSYVLTAYRSASARASLIRHLSALYMGSVNI